MITDISNESRTRLFGHQVVAAVSGGKDSTAMCLWLREQGIPHSRVFADTGWEAPETYAYLDELRDFLGPIRTVRNEKLWESARPGDGGMVELIRQKQMFPSRTRRFCTEKLKLAPLKLHMEALADDMPVINAIGIRAAESQARSKLTARSAAPARRAPSATTRWSPTPTTAGPPAAPAAGGSPRGYGPPPRLVAAPAARGLRT